MAKEKKSQHKGQFIGGYFEQDHLDKLAVVEARFDEDFGDKGRNRSRALRYILESFDLSDLKYFPKDRPRASENDRRVALAR